jgi:hypothetical protein
MDEPRVWLACLVTRLFDSEFVFVHSYSSNAGNWRQVMLEDGTKQGRVPRAIAVARQLQVPGVANDSLDAVNAALYQNLGIENLMTARDTKAEVISALACRRAGEVLFVTSPDHLPRVVRDALAQGATRSLFMASDISFSDTGPQAVAVREPLHEKGAFTGQTPSK